MLEYDEIRLMCKTKKNPKPSF